MAEIGALGGLNYEMTFPQQRQFAAQQQPMLQPQEVDLPEYSNDPIAVRGKLTGDYYDSMGLLRSFAQDMAKKGINVFEPDYSQEGGGLAFQTMQKLQANLMHSANKLRNEFEFEKQTRPYLLTGQTAVDPNVDLTQGTPYSDPNNFFATKQLPGTEELNQRLAQETNDPNSSARINAQIKPYTDRLDNMVAQGLISPAKAEAEKQSIVANAWRTQPYAPRSARGLSQEDIMGRAQLIKQVKQGIVTGDRTGVNMLKLVPGVEDVQYVNTGDEVGLQVWHKGQPQPSFVDLSQGGGEGDINALLNRIEGQKNVPNESVFTFDTKVSIPASNVGKILTDVKTKVKEFSPDTVSKLQELAASGKLITATGEPVAAVEIDGPTLGLFGKTELKITHYPVTNGRVNYSRKSEKFISDPAELDAFIQTNANQIAPSFGGGFVENIDPDI